MSLAASDLPTPVRPTTARIDGTALVSGMFPSLTMSTYPTSECSVERTWTTVPATRLRGGAILVVAENPTFLDLLADAIKPTPSVRLLLLAHLLPDKMPMIRVLRRTVDLIGVIPVPYSR